MTSDTTMELNALVPSQHVVPDVLTAGPAGSELVASSIDPLTATDVAEFGELTRRVSDAISTVLLGKPEVIRLMLAALLAEGHVLVEDVPGVGKTTLARAVAATIHGVWRPHPVHP